MRQMINTELTENLSEEVSKFENVSRSLEDNFNQITKYSNLRFIGYLTTPLIFGFFIVKHSNSKIEYLEKEKKKIIDILKKEVSHKYERLDKTYKEILKVDTYLIYHTKTSFLNDLSLFLNISKFWIDKESKLPTDFIIYVKNYQKQVYNIKQKIGEYNSEFLKRRKKEYEFLFKKDSLTLDDDQQTAIVTDDKHNLVVAGAGSGKTEVLITRIAYLVKRKPDTINSERILALAFQNKAANEIKERLLKRYGIDVEIRTFHSLGRKIIDDAYKISRKKIPELKQECSEDWKFQIYIKKLFDKILSEDSKLQNQMVSFMKSYGDNEIIREEADFDKKEEYYKYQRDLTYTALDGTKVKSESERTILNFFVLNNLNGEKVKILYEQQAPWMKYKDKNEKEYTPKPDFYFPDFDIYLEHWAIGKNGKVPDWFSGENPTKEYVDHMNSKKKQFEINKKILIETSQADFETREFNDILKKRFLEVLKKKYPDKKFEFTSLSYNEIVERVWQECKEFVTTIAINLSRFIVIAKTYSLSPEEINKRLDNEKWSPKQYAFGKIATQIYDVYEKNLREANQIDFSDMINLAVKELKNNRKLYSELYDHILIDEYQDISTQRYELIKNLMDKNSSCKLFCVGDDWQSIMGFAGSNLDFFIHFEKYFDHPVRTDLTKNYRSIQSIVEVGANIIKNNKEGQIKKKTIANNNESKPILVYSSLHQKEYYVPYYEQIAKHCLDKIKEYYDTGGYSYGDFMILLRIAQKPKLRNFITEYATRLNIPISEEPDKPNCVHIMSVHKSKGLQARVVLILNVDKDLYGFPCELESPEIFEPAIKNNDGLREQEERRLFYVAVTRAKEEVIMYTQKCSESKFITEIKEFIKKEELRY